CFRAFRTPGAPHWAPKRAEHVLAPLWPHNGHSGGYRGMGFVPGSCWGYNAEKRRVAPALGGREAGWLADAIHPHAVLATYGVYGQAHFLSKRAADESPYAVGLPTGRLHDLGERCAALPLEQAQHLGLLAAV